MARDNDKSIQGIDKRINSLTANVDKLYQTTYQSRMDDKKDMDSIIGSIDDSMDSLLSKINGQSIEDISALYLRLQNKSDSGPVSELNKSISNVFDENRQIIDSINVDNIRKSIQAEDYQYDLICKYMTKLEDAIDIKKDNVLSSDNFTKEFINIISGKSNREAIQQFNDRAESIKNKYKFQDLCEEMYYDASKYGEYFLYHVPYKKAFERLLTRKATVGTAGVRYESAQGNDSKECILEATAFDGNIGGSNTLSKDYMSSIKENDVKVNIIFDESCILAEPISAVKEAMTVSGKYSSITESYFVESTGQVKEVSESQLKYDDGLSTDGFVDKNGKSTKITDKLTGSVLSKIPRDEIFPICMDRTCIGYINLLVNNDYVENMVMNGYSYNSLTNNTKLMGEEFDKQNDMFVSYIASMISDKIDAKFINSNIDLKEQIYSVLRYNDKFCCTNGVNNITVTFLPADDVHHFYFRLNEDTHRGISDLEKSIVPAMVYCLLYLNTTIGQISRSQDKRVYYVKQNVETNVAKTLLNVVNQLKKGNMGMRQLENMNTIFNVVGRYNDHIIPMGQQGDPPIQMEVLQGQQIDTPTEMMDRMEDAAVSSTDVPLEFVQSTNQVDYATRFTMSNSKFLRKVYKRQRICQEHFTDIFRRLYNYEYLENEQSMKILLPAPSFLAMTNSQQLIDNVKNYATAIAEITCAGETDETKEEFINICVRNYLGTYVDFDQIDTMIAEARHTSLLRSNGDDDGAGNY